MNASAQNRQCANAQLCINQSEAKTMKTKQDRIEIVNKIIAEIAKHDRQFLSNHSDGHYSTDPKKINHFLIKENLIYLKNHYTTKGNLINMSREHFRNPLCHGGTLWALLQDFANFIKTGKYSNHKNGYGGLYCHTGDMN